MTNQKDKINDEADDKRELNEQEKCQHELNSALKERDEYLDLAKRAKAEFINYKKDEEKRFEKFRKLAKIETILKIFEVLDSFNQAIGFKKDTDEWANGILKIKDQLEVLIAKEGVKQIAVKAGDKFDPAFHESLGEVESDKDEGLVAEELRAGYQIEDFVLRPTQVKISKHRE